MGAVTQLHKGVSREAAKRSSEKLNAWVSTAIQAGAERYAEVPPSVLPLIDIACDRTASARRLLNGFSTPVSKLKAKADLVEAQDAIKEALRRLGQ